MIPQTFFSSFFKDKVSLLIDNKVYRSCRHNSEICLRWRNKEEWFTRGCSIENLENAYFERYENELQKYTIALAEEKRRSLEHIATSIDMLKSRLKPETAQFIEFANIIMHGSNEVQKNEKKECIATKMLRETFRSNAVFVYRNNFYPLLEFERGEILFGNSRRILGRQVSAEEIDKDYKNRIQNRLCKKVESAYTNLKKEENTIRAVMSRKYYDKQRNMGFEIINNDFFAITIVEPYILYERSNGKYYLFDTAKIGSKMTKIGNSIELSPLIVINSYSHPYLSQKDTPFQRICTGSFDYATIRHGGIYEQIHNILRFGRKLLTRGYRFTGSGERPYRTLDSFPEKETKKPSIALVTNL